MMTAKHSQSVHYFLIRVQYRKNTVFTFVRSKTTELNVSAVTSTTQNWPTLSALRQHGDVMSLRWNGGRERCEKFVKNSSVKHTALCMGIVTMGIPQKSAGLCTVVLRIIQSHRYEMAKKAVHRVCLERQIFACRTSLSWPLLTTVCWLIVSALSQVYS